MAMTTIRELLVAGRPPEGLGRPANWPRAQGVEALSAVSRVARQQIIVADLLSRLLVKGDAAYVQLFALAGTGSEPAPLGEPLAAPPMSKFEGELHQVEAQAMLRTARASEILAQLRFSPALWANVLPLNPRATPATLELMSVTVAFASHVVQRAKLLFNVPRPNELSPRIQPIVATPGYSAYPSGHATESFLIADVLERIVTQGGSAAGSANPALSAWLERAKLGDMLRTLAQRIADNRIVAGLHYPVDTDGALKLVGLLASYLATRAHAAPAPDDTFGWLWTRAVREWGAST